MQRSDGSNEAFPAGKSVGPAEDPIAQESMYRAVGSAEDDFEEPEWARGLGLTEENVRDAFADVGAMFRNMAVAQVRVPEPTVPVTESKRGRVTLRAADATYSASYVVSGSTLTIQSAGVQRTLTLAKVSASLEKVVKQVLSAMIAQGQPVLRSTR